MRKAKWASVIVGMAVLGIFTGHLCGLGNMSRQILSYLGSNIDSPGSTDGREFVCCSERSGNPDLCLVPGKVQQEQEGEKFFSSYEGMRARLEELYQQQKYAEAAELLDKALLRFPGHIKANTYNLALMCAHLNQLDRGVSALLYGLEHGVWYGKFDFFNALWDPYKKHSGFQTFLDKNHKYLERAQKTAKSQLMIKTPADYSPNKEYPLFVALHGGGENMADFSQRWRSEKLENQFIVAFIQSSQVISMDGYNWTEDMEISRKEIQEAYHKILQEYPVNTELVLIGGFSSGGVASLELALDGTLPVQGFVVLCPAKPEGFTSARVQAAAQRGLRGTILTTEMDGRLEDQKAMARIFDLENLPCEFIITPDIGHWYPEDLDVQIDRALARILDK